MITLIRIGIANKNDELHQVINSAFQFTGIARGKEIKFIVGKIAPTGAVL